MIDPDVGDPYPLERCLFSDKPLDEDYEVIDYQGREIRVCCNDWVDRFSGESTTRIDQINALLVQEQIPFYPLRDCGKSGE